MDQSLSIWVLIVLSVITANLPFLVEKPLLVLPWSLPGERSGLSPWLQLIVGLVYLLVLAALGLGIYTLIASSSGLNSLPLMVGKLLLGLALAAALFFFPAWRARHQKISKGFLSRLLEVCALYCIVGAFGFAFEASIGNPFK